MGDERLCDCGSAADWEEIGSTWICTACRDKDVQKNIEEIKEALARMNRMERYLKMFKVDTGAIPGLLDKLKDEVGKIRI